MDEDRPKKHKRRFGIAEFLFLILIAGIVVVAFLVFAGRGEVRTSESEQADNTSILVCKASDPANKFFSYKTENSAVHEVKIIFDNGDLDKINYNYTARYATNDEVETALSWMHADYNNYMGTISVYQEDLTPTFSAVGTEAIINLYFGGKTLNSETARFVFLTSDEYAKIKNMSTKSIEKMYRGKGFSCNFSE